MEISTKEQVEHMRKQYPQGTRIELISLVEDDHYCSLKPGDRGTVDWIDAIGDAVMIWDNGSSLNLLPEDQFKVVNDDEAK
jgi:hypothetical protein